MITIAICDDNAEFASLLRAHLQRLCAYSVPERIDVHLAPTFHSAGEVLSYLEQSTIDILFLDIDMPRTSGFELAKTLCSVYPETVIIFVSSYEEFVYSSFEFCPFQFLRKAHLDKELPSTLERVIKKCVLDTETLLFDTADGDIVLRIRDILYFEGERNYYHIYTAGGRIYRCRGTMKELERVLEKYDFFRIHSAYIVNLEHIESIGSQGYLIMKNQKSLSISKKRASLFKHSYMQFTRRRVSK